jgi:predicted nucleic acid-binding Zn ribbon protein
MTRYRRSPRPLEAAFARLADDLAPETLLGAVQRAWPGAVGELIAAEARPTSERGGVLTIACSASVWAQELDLMAPQILGRLNERLSEGVVQRLRCVAVGHSERPFG